MVDLEKEQEILVDRISFLCKERGYTIYQLAYESTLPVTTIFHIMDGSTRNPGIFTIIKICDGLKVSLSEFFDTEEFAALIRDV